MAPTLLVSDNLTVTQAQYRAHLMPSLSMFCVSGEEGKQCFSICTYVCVCVCVCVCSRLSYSSCVLVIDAPRFQDCNNCTKWLEFPISSSFKFSCSLNSTGNPPLKAGISYVNTTADISNVNATLSKTSLVYTVSNATINNRVNLTCVANSSYAVTTANYLAFVGGVYVCV